jgi:ferredoxin
MRSWAFQTGFEDRLLQSLRRDYRVLAPVQGADGVGRLQPVRSWAELSPGVLPLIPLKKVVFPPHDVLWTLMGNEYREPAPSSVPVALVGIAPCDLYALAYLDLVFADDPHYQRRRQGLLLVGSSCQPTPECFCPPRREPPPFDLFLASGRLWCGSATGEALLQPLLADLSPPGDQPLPDTIMRGQQKVPENLEQLFAESAGRALWQEVGQRCVSCGACSAVCPTCYCYDVVDDARPDGSVTRLREWDNCFFRSHALVAGGHNFRPTRKERLRFRFEHKLLGFGPLRGVSSCVGCGRCGRACPVDIDISEVLSMLTTGEKR